MRIALVNSNRKSTFYPIALLKIGAWLKSKGNKCVLFDNILPKPNIYDEIWITTVFTFDVYYVKQMIIEAKKRAKIIRVGGVSASLLPEFFKRLNIEVHVGLLKDAERCHPDYSLLNEIPEYSCVYTSRGCTRKCKFCMVHKIEPFIPKREWLKDICVKTKNIKFFDNNILSKKEKDLFKDLEILHKLVKDGKIKKIDFNQGLDVRLLNNRIAKQLKNLPISPIRFAFDGPQEDGYYQQAIKIMSEMGFKNFMTYKLYNFKDTPEEFYYRLKESVKLSDEFKISVGSFPMRYQPILQIDSKRGYTGENWKVIEKKAFQAILSEQSVCGQISLSDIKKFEFWFGKNENEFKKLLNYPKIAKLSLRKNVELRESGWNKILK